MRKAASIAVITTLLFVVNLYGQIGKDTDLWKWGQKRDIHNSVVRIETVSLELQEDGSSRFMCGSGTGTVIKELDNNEYLVLTANHVIPPSEFRGRVKSLNKIKTAGITVVAKDYAHDICILKIKLTEDSPKLPVMKIADVSPQYKDSLEFAGYGGVEFNEQIGLDKLRVYMGTAEIPTGDDYVFSGDAYLIQGDSGGPVIVNDQLVGVISGGSCWWGKDICKTQNGEPVKITWPAMAFGIGPIKELLKQAEEVLEKHKNKQ